MRNKYVDEGLELVGNNNRYQIITCFLLLITGIFADIMHSGMPLMETPPIVNFESDGKLIQKEINYSICKHYQNFTVNSQESKSSWVNDYNIFCDKFLVSLLGFIYLLGGMIGTLFVQFLKNKGAKFGFIFVSLLMSFAGVLLFFQNIFIFYLFLFIYGFCSLNIFIFKVNIMTEITHKSYRSYYNNIIISGGNISLMINYFLFDYNFNWKTVYYFNSVVILGLSILFFKVYVESPRFYLVKDDKRKMIESLLYIAKFNGKDKSLNFKENFENFYIQIKGEKEREMNNLDIVSDRCLPSDKKIENIVLHSENSKTQNSVMRVSTREILEENNHKEVPKNSTSKLLYLNYILSYPLGNFLYFLFMFEIKEFSYEINSVIYYFCAISIIFSFLISPVMNNLGRKLTKILLMGIFLSLFILSKYLQFTWKRENTLNENYDTFINIYLICRLILHLSSTVNHTHINEVFPSTNRLKLFGLSFTISKVLILFAPFIYEYLKLYKVWIIICTSIFLLIAFSFQKETSNKSLEDY
jgi:hypothetical protein